MTGQHTYNAAMSAARALEDLVDEFLAHETVDAPELRNEAHALRRKLEAFAMTVRPAHLGGPVVSETDMPAKVIVGEKITSMSEVQAIVVNPTIPPGLCGFRGCVFLTNHEKGPHSWQVA